MKYAFYVSGNAGRLRKIIENKETFLSKTVVVVSDDAKNCDLKEILEAVNIKYVLIDYGNLDGDKNLKLSDRMLETFRFFHVDYCFSFGDHILKGELLKAYKNKIINFHPSILPAFRGRKAIDQAIENNAFLLGCSAHFIDEGVDTGSVIMQAVMSSEVYRRERYDGVLDTQIEMLRRIADALSNHTLSVEGGRVKIANADYTEKVFFPGI